MEIIFEDKTKLHTITEIAEKTDLHPQTIRNWEELGLLSPQRLSGGRRVYGEEELIQVEKIVFLKKQGLNIKAIKYILTVGLQ